MHLYIDYTTNGTNEMVIIPQSEDESDFVVRNTEEEEGAYVQKIQ